MNPEPEKVNIWQATTYIRTGVMPDPDELRSMFDAAEGFREPVEFREMLETDAQVLLEHARAGRITVFAKSDEEPTRPVPVRDLCGDLWVYVLEDMIAPDAFKDFGAEKPLFRDVCFLRSELSTLRNGPRQDFARKVNDAAERILAEGRVAPGRGCLAAVVMRLEEDRAFFNAARDTLRRYARPAVMAFKAKASRPKGPDSAAAN